MKRKNKTKTKNKNLFYKIISILLGIISIIFLSFLFYIDLLPFKFMIIIVLSIIIFSGLNIWLLNIKKLKRKIKKFLSVISILVMIVMLAASFYLYRTIDVLFGNGESKYKLAHYSLIVLDSSDYENLSDIKGKRVGYYENSIGSKEANEHLEDEFNIDFESYNSSDTLISDLLNSDIEIILIEDSVKEIMSEEMDDFSNSIRVIYTFTIKVKVESTLKDVDVTKDSFAVYVSGIDTYGEISSVSRSDVNMVVIVNPSTKQVLLISIPRDYYVQLHGTTGVKDKLTHAGIYGVDMSTKTIEDLLELDINYYIKVNFTSVIDIVDALGGLDVYSEYSFISYSGYSFKKGYNSVNGEQALDFARTRKAFVNGDRQRGINQQALIEAMIRKVTDKSVITKYNSLLSAIDGKYQTNMSSKKITSLVKMQLSDMPSWNITSYSLTGTDSTNYTYTYYQKLYIMEPDSSSVEEAIDIIDKVLNGEILTSSYGEVSGSSNKVIQVKPQTTTTTQNTEKKEEETIENDDSEIETEDKKTEEDIEENIDNEEETPGLEDSNIEEDNESDESLSSSDSEINEENNEQNNEQNNEDDVLENIIPTPSSDN